MLDSEHLSSGSCTWKGRQVCRKGLSGACTQSSGCRGRVGVDLQGSEQPGRPAGSFTQSRWAAHKATLRAESGACGSPGHEPTASRPLPS